MFGFLSSINSVTLESFLQKSLREDANRVRLCESAMVTMGKEQYALKFVVVTDRFLFITQNPPENIQYAIPVSNITSIIYVSQYDSLINGRDYEMSQHITIHYDENKRKKKKSSFRSDPNESVNHDTLSTTNILTKSLTPTFRPLTSMEPKSDMESNSDTVTLKMDIYVRNQKSPFLAILRASRRDSLILDTLSMQEELFPKSQQHKVRRDIVENLFSELITDLEGTSSLDGAYKLVRELKASSERNFLVKKFFWRSSVAFAPLLDLIKPCLDGTGDINLRLDELELCTSVFETISELIFQCDHLVDRLSKLEADSLRIPSFLIRSILSTPFGFTWPTCHEILIAFRNRRSDEENIYLTALTEWFISGCRLLTVLVNVAKHTPYVSSRSALTVDWIFNYIQNQNEMENFFKRLMICVVICLDVNESDGYISAQDTVWIYQVVSFLNCAMHVSSSLSKLIKESFAEEFKYYLQKTYIKNKINPQFPLCFSLLEICKETSKLVLK